MIQLVFALIFVICFLLLMIIELWKALRKAARHMLEDEMNWHPGRFVFRGASVKKPYCVAKRTHHKGDVGYE